MIATNTVVLKTIVQLRYGVQVNGPEDDAGTSLGVYGRMVTLQCLGFRV